MRIVVHMLFNLESCALLLHLHTEHDVQVFILFTGFLVPNSVRIIFRIIGILHIVTGMMPIGFLVYASLYEVIIEVFQTIIFTL